MRTGFQNGRGADPSMFASILALDMGGYPLAMELCTDPLLGVYSGIIAASILGCTIVFVIPVGLGLLEEKDYGYFAEGLMLGLAAMPIGTVTGGLMLKYKKALRAGSHWGGGE